mgnify:CR=1 FL=1
MLEALQFIISVLLLLCILLQNRGTGLSSTFGGSGAGAYVQRRGAEKLLYQMAVWLSVAFFALSVIRWYL